MPNSPVLDSEIHCLAQTADVCGEGVLFHEQHNAVYWTDINRCLLHCLDLATRVVRTSSFDQPVTSVQPTTDKDTLLVVLGGRAILWRPADTRIENTLFELSTWPKVRCNDAGISPGGDLWIGTMQNNIGESGETLPVNQASGELLQVTANGAAHVWISEVLIANTVTWSPDGSLLYFADTLRNEISVYSFDASTQEISARRSFHAAHSRGLPDGSAVDSEGHLWNCRYGGGCIVRFAPNGRVDQIIETPVANPTSCVFGGDDLRTLFFTSAGEGKQPGGPTDGGLFCVRTRVAGHPRSRFRLKR
jgi:sugar lactone lactonase YvrE